MGSLRWKTSCICDLSFDNQLTWSSKLKTMKKQIFCALEPVQLSSSLPISAIVNIATQRCLESRFLVLNHNANIYKTLKWISQNFYQFCFPPNVTQQGVLGYLHFHFPLNGWLPSMSDGGTYHRRAFKIEQWSSAGPLRDLMSKGLGPIVNKSSLFLHISFMVKKLQPF